MNSSINDADVDCKDIVDFQRRLTRLRNAEDKIIFRLNTELPTSSFTNKHLVTAVCDDIEKKLTNLRRCRSQLIYKCVRENQQIVNDFRHEEAKFADVRTAHYNLRVLKDENAVDEIVAQQTDKLVHDRCRKEML